MKKIKIAYYGTPDFSALLLEKLLIDTNPCIEIVFAVTQPDKPMGRKKTLTSSPVKITAQKYHIPVYHDTNDIPSSLFLSIALCIVYAYGQIIPTQFLHVPLLGFWNIHPSLLPKYRGPSPIAYPLLLGDDETGVSLMQMDEKIDHGNIIAQEKIPIAQSDTRSDLEITLTDMAYELIKKTIVQLNVTQLTDFHTKAQDHDSATYTHLLTKDDGFVALEVLKKALSGETINEKYLPYFLSDYLTQYPHEKIQLYKRSFDLDHRDTGCRLRHSIGIDFGLFIFNLFRALSPWPGIWTKVKINNQERRLKLIHILFEQNKLNINRVQLEGKKEVDFIQFNTAYKIV